MAKKLKYGLSKKNQKETNRLMTLNIAYDAEEDEMSVGIAIRNDAQDPELLLRVEEHLSKSLRFIANGGEAYAKEADVTGYIAKDAKKGK